MLASARLMAHTADAEDSLDLSAGGRARTVHCAPRLPRMLSPADYNRGDGCCSSSSRAAFRCSQLLEFQERL